MEAAAAVTDKHNLLKKSGRLNFKPADFIICAIAAALTIAVSWMIYANAAPSRVVITYADSTYVYPLGEDREVQIQGSSGATTIDIREGKAAIVNSPCRNKTCVQSGHVSRSGEWVACLPNGIFVRIEGEQHEANQLDAVVR